MIGSPAIHDSGYKHTTGEAVYIDDQPSLTGELSAAPVLSRIAHGRILRLDAAKALALPGVVRIITAADIPGENEIGVHSPGEYLLPTGIVEHYGQPIALVLAVDQATARRASRLVEVDYDPLEPVFDIGTALERRQFVAPPRTVARGDAKAALRDAPHRASGSIEIGGQEHLYLEGQIALAIPQEDGGMLLHASTQHPTETQRIVAAVLGLPMSRVVVEVRRMGGGFGGKETNAGRWACLAALAADVTRRPVRLRLARADDMVSTGKRHDFLVTYTVGFDDDGMINGLVVDLAAKAGYNNDLSSSVVDVALLNIDNCYFIPDIQATGYACKTNTVSNTAFRGFGAAQAILAIERIMETIADRLNCSPVEVRQANFYGVSERNTTPYGQTVGDNIIGSLFASTLASAEHAERLRAVEAFNRESPILKRGIAVVPVKFGVALNKNQNQGAALINIYFDGSITVNHGGTEMGQGLYIKVAQIVANALEVGLERIEVSAARTDKIPNTSQTAGSTGTDINGMAALNAALKLRKRLLGAAADYFGCDAMDVEISGGWFFAADKRASFDAIVAHAYQARVNLSAKGFYKTPGLWFDAERGEGRPFHYFVYGAACSEVVVDTLTGEIKVLRSDILQDVGRSINPAIDLGQTEGAFVQGIGWLTCEELCWTGEGRLSTDGPATYKIPTAAEMPRILNATLLPARKNSENTVFRSKAVGEPPLILATSVWLAIRHAIQQARGTHDIVLKAPATPENILLALTAPLAG